MTIEPCIVLEIVPSPTLTKDQFELIFERAASEGISVEAFVEKVISRELETA